MGRPTILFTIDQGALVASTQQALDKINAQIAQSTKQNSAQIVSQIANPLQAMTAKLRAAFATGAIGIQQMQAEQKKFVALLDTEITLLRQRDVLTKSELSTLKQLTLERERQANALQRGIGVGVTSGTSSALGLVTSGVSASITRNISQLGARLTGIAGGSGAETAILSGAAASLTQITAAGGPAIAILGGVAGAALAAAAAATSLAISGGKIVENFSFISQKTGISIKDLQTLDVVAKTSGTDLDSLVTGFKKFSKAVVGGGDGEGDVVGAGKKASEVLKLLGVSAKEPIAALEQTADAVSKLPAGFLKDATVTELFGKSAIGLIPFLNKGRDGINELRAVTDKYAATISGDALKSQEDYKLSTIKLGLAFDSLKISAIPLLDVLTKITTASADAVSFLEKKGPGLFSVLEPLAGKSSNGVASLLSLFKSGNSAGAPSSSGSGKATFFGIDFDAADAAITKINPKIKALQDLLDGTTEALRKSMAEGAKEFAALNEEAGKSGLAKIAEIGTQSSIAGLTPQDKVLEEQRQKLQAIAEIMLNFPQFANQAQGAIISLTKSTTEQLEKLADDALKKAQDEGDKLTADEEKRQAEVAQLIKDSADRVTIARAEASGNASAKIIADEQKILDDAITKASQRGATEQQLQQLIINANQAAADKIANLQREQLKKTQDEIKTESGKLFDALVSGGGKNFGTAIKNLLTGIALAPVRTVFESVATAIFTPIVTATKKGLTGLGQSLKGQGGILGAIGASLAPDDKTILNTQITSQNTLATQSNTDAVNGLTGLLSGSGGTGTGTGTAPSSGGGLLNFGRIFGGSTPGSGGLIFNNQPFGSSGLDNLPLGDVIGRSGGGLSSGGSSGSLGGLSSLSTIFKDVAPFVTGITALATSGGNTGVKVGGAVSLAGASISKIGQALKKSNPDLSASLGKLGGIIGGIGDATAGLIQGGAQGLLETTIGGAEIGGTVGGPIGAAIGAGIGFVAGGIRALFGGPSKAQQIAKAITKQTVNSSIFSGNAFIGQEFDRSAQESFAKTVGSTFSEGPGGVFSSSPLNDSAPITVHYAPTIQAFDATGVNAVLAQHGTTIAQAISGKVSSSNSGIGRAVRTAAFPA
jgi:hypothetical protein